MFDIHISKTLNPIPAAPSYVRSQSDACSSEDYLPLPPPDSGKWLGPCGAL